VWHPTSPGNRDVLICINAPFMTQRVLKPWWSWTYQNSAVKRAFARAIPRLVISWEVWFGEPKRGQYCVIGGRSLQMVSEPFAQPEMVGACTSPWGLPVGTRWDAKNGVIPWGSPAGTLDPKGGWLWHPTSPGNGDVLICINAPFMTQRVLKPWWSWTYQNSAFKRAFARAIPGW